MKTLVKGFFNLLYYLHMGESKIKLGCKIASFALCPNVPTQRFHLALAPIWHHAKGLIALIS